MTLLIIMFSIIFIMFGLLIFSFLDTHKCKIESGVGVITGINIEQPEKAKPGVGWTGKVTEMIYVQEPITQTITISSFNDKRCKYTTNLLKENLNIGDSLKCEYYLGRITKSLYITKIERT